MTPRTEPRVAPAGESVLCVAPTPRDEYPSFTLLVHCRVETLRARRDGPSKSRDIARYAGERHVARGLLRDRLR